MLSDFPFHTERRTQAECKALLKVRREELAGLQQRLQQAGLPVIVLLEGWSASGKGRTIQSLIRELDPRFFKVISVNSPTDTEKRWPFLKRHFETIPAQGKVLFLDTGWMEETVRAYLRRLNPYLRASEASALCDTFSRNQPATSTAPSASDLSHFSPAASSSGWPLPGRWPAKRLLFSLMNQQVT